MALDKLSYREKQIMELRFGLSTKGKEKTQKEHVFNSNIMKIIITRNIMKYHFSTLLFLLFTFNISAQQKVPENNIIPMNHSVRPQETLTLWMTSHQTTGWIFHFLSVTNN